MGQIYCNKHKRSDMDSCEECDKETANPVYYRGLRVSVFVNRAWLTNDFEDQDEGAGWKELEQQISRSLSYLGIKEVAVDFEEWEGPAEEEKDAYLLERLQARLRRR